MILLAWALLAAAQQPQATPPPVTGPDIIVNRNNDHSNDPCGPPFARLYVAPMGEPVRGDGRTDPEAAWFAKADADHDGHLTLAEFTADADRFFATLDDNHDGEIDPEELSNYENQDVPEIKLYQPGQYRHQRTAKARHADKKAARARADYDTPYGAGLYASLNIPEPVVSADLDLNRGVSRAEFRQVASTRFAMLDTGGQGVLTLASLPRSPAQQEIDDCRASETKKKGK